MGRPAARKGDFHICPKRRKKVPHIGGPGKGGSGKTTINGNPALRKGDPMTCINGGTDTITGGSSGVFIDGKPAARMGDMTSHSGVIVMGSMSVFIGETGNYENGTPIEWAAGEPESLQDAVKRLGKIQAYNTEHGYQPLYNDVELESFASNTLNNHRFLVSFQSKKLTSTTHIDNEPTKKAKKKAKKEANEAFAENMDRGRLNGKTAQWIAPYSQVAAAGTDPELIANSLGVPYDPDAEYQLFIIDLGEQPLDADTVMHPTWENVRALCKRELGNRISPEMIDTVMTPEYQETFAELVGDFRNYVKEEELEKGAMFKKKPLRDFLASTPLTPEDKGKFAARYEIRAKVGANEYFTGDGSTKLVKPIPGREDQTSGVNEILLVESEPKKIKQLIANQTIAIVPCVKEPAI